MSKETCRICLGAALKPHCVSILDNVYKSGKTVSQIISECASVKVSEQDILPKFICIKCFQQLVILYEFRILIITSDLHLKRNNVSSSPGADDSEQLLAGDINIKDESEFLRSCEKNVDTKENFPKKINNFKSSIPEETSASLYSKLSNIKEANCASVLESEKLEEKNIQKLSVAVRKPGRKPKLTTSKRTIHKFQCDICKKILFGRSNRLQQHIIMAHSDIKNFVCEVCEKRFKSKQQLVNHKRVHTGEKPYRCDVCEEAFATPQNLFNHKKKHTGSYKSYKCDLCDKRYSTPGELQTHNRIVHTGEKPFLCEICSKAYSSVRNLGLHRRSVHEKNEKCPKCGLMLNIKRLKQHIEKHQNREEGIRSYTCDKCGKGFFSYNALRRHQQLHSGEKPYSCEVCRKSFSQKSALDTHMKVHSDLRSYCCAFCPKTFKYKQHLQTHLKKHQKEDMSKVNTDDDSYSAVPMD